MKAPTILLLLFALGGGSLSAQPVTVPALGPRYKQTRERAEILFGHRNGDYPAPDARYGIFQPPTEKTPSVVDIVKTPANEKNIPSDEARLNNALAILVKGKGGLVVRGGRTVLTVGVRVYREGDILSVPTPGGPTNLRIAQITANSVTLVLNDNEAVWRF